jgi:hypothetical protein
MFPSLANSLKMSNKILLAFFLGCTSAAFGQVSFSPAPQGTLPGPHFSGVAVAVSDMDGDGRDDIARLQQGIQLNVLYQTTPNAPFAEVNSMGQLANDSQWGMCVADVNNDGRTDVLAGGYYDGVKVAMANADGSAFMVSTYSNPSTFVQAVNFADVNNDGWVDAFVCHDDGVARIFGNNGDGTFTFQPNWIDLTTTPASDNSGNYGSVWSDVNNDGLLDLYIAKCRQGVNSATDPRRINQLFLNNGDGTYTQDTANATGLRIGAQSWTADFGDIDNDGDFDCFITNHDVSSQLLINDGAGHFTDISVAAGIFNQVTGLPIQGVFRDFDNDGFVDIIVAGTQHHLFHNNGNNTFTKVPNLLNNNNMTSFAIGDLNSDGYQDIYASYTQIYTDPSNTPDVLWLNNGGTNHYFGLSLRGNVSNRSAVGAKVILHTPQGIQVREVRAGESYGISNSMLIHFGLGQNTVIDSVSIRWPSGLVDVLEQPTADQYLSVAEGGCTLPAQTINTAMGTTVFCTGDSLQINAPLGFAYTWSNGATTQSIFATQAGSYRVTLTEPITGCLAISNVVTVSTDPIETPSIAVSGETTFCAGQSVALSASAASGYLWSNGATTQTIAAAETGQYAVTTQGLCSTFQSTAVSVTVLASASAATTVGDTTNIGGFALLSAAGDSLRWYDAPAGGNVVNTGTSLLLDPVFETTTFWVENAKVYATPNQFGGMIDHAGSNFSANSTNGQVIFDALQPFRLKSVKTYTNTLGNRRIMLTTTDGTLIAAKTVSIPAGPSVVTLDFDVPAGNDLILTTDEAVNETIFGFASPLLRRSDSGVTYPYVVPNILNIKGSNFGETRYYYFFNWEIELPSYLCAAQRVPVVAFVDSLSSTQMPNLDAANQVRIYPNPSAEGHTWVTMPTGVQGRAQFNLRNALGRSLHQTTLDVPAANPVSVSLANLPAGVYWLEWQFADRTVRGRVVVQ